jgi:hypothetical protein
MQKDRRCCATTIDSVKKMQIPTVTLVGQMKGTCIEHGKDCRTPNGDFARKSKLHEHGNVAWDAVGMT